MCVYVYVCTYASNWRPQAASYYLQVIPPHGLYILSATKPKADPGLEKTGLREAGQMTSRSLRTQGLTLLGPNQTPQVCVLLPKRVANWTSNAHRLEHS